jgi:hypothetical protein
MGVTAASTSRPRAVALTAAFLFGAVALPSALAASGLLTSDSKAVVGQLVARHADDFQHGRSTNTYIVQTDNGARPVRVSDREAARLVGKRVQAVVRADGTSALLPASGGTTTTTTALASESYVAGPRRLAVVLVNFSNDTRQPWTQQQVRNVAFDDVNQSVAAYYRQASWGQISLSGDVLGWFTIPNANTTCDYETWASSANSAALAAGVDLSGYDFVAYAFPSTSACGWTGLGYMPGKYSWLNGAGTSLRAMAHELGHNLGTNHANTLVCTEAGQRVSLSANAGSCVPYEYGDPFSVMGGANHYEPTNVSRGNMGLLQPANTLTVAASGDYALKPIGVYDASAVQVLRVRRTPSTYFTLELRQSDGSYFDAFSATDPAVNGITVRIASDYTTRNSTQLVDTTPATLNFADAALAVGRTLVDPLTGVSITTVGLSPLGATVHISLGADTTPPTQPTSLAATALDASRIALTWSSSTDDVGVAGYFVYRGSALVGTVATPGFGDSGLDPLTTYAYQVVAFDSAGNTSSAVSVSATTLAATPTTPTTPTTDTQPPTMPGSIGATVNKRKVTLSWTASADDTGVAGYRVLRNGALVATLGPTSLGYTNNGVPRGAQAYGIEAFDATGNTSVRAITTVSL